MSALIDWDEILKFNKIQHDKLIEIMSNLQERIKNYRLDIERLNNIVIHLDSINSDLIKEINNIKEDNRLRDEKMKSEIEYLKKCFNINSYTTKTFISKCESHQYNKCEFYQFKYDVYKYLKKNSDNVESSNYRIDEMEKNLEIHGKWIFEKNFKEYFSNINSKDPFEDEVETKKDNDIPQLTRRQVINRKKRAKRRANRNVKKISTIQYGPLTLADHEAELYINNDYYRNHMDWLEKCRIADRLNSMPSLCNNEKPCSCLSCIFKWTPENLNG